MSETDRFTEAELAELENKSAASAPWTPAERKRLIASARLANSSVERILAERINMARLANEQAERIALAEHNGRSEYARAENYWTIVQDAECRLPGVEVLGERIQNLIDAQSLCEQQLADRDATIQRLESECDSLRRRWHDLERIQDRQLTFDSVAMELADSEEKRRQADATIARLTAERDARGMSGNTIREVEQALIKWNEAPTRVGDTTTVVEVIARIILERDAARDRLAKAREALRSAHCCATWRDDGSCDGCPVSGALEELDK